MKFQTEEGRIYLDGEDGKPRAEVCFPAEDGTTVNITHTFVDDSLRGQGVAGKLMEAAAGELRRRGKKARLTCPYAVKWFALHPEQRDVLR